VSVGEPQVIFSNGKDILRVNGATGAKFDPVASTPGADEEDATWSADATHVAYTADGRVFLQDLTKKDATAIPLTPASDQYHDLAWAPTADVNLLAMDKEVANGDRDLCLGQITKDGMTPQCFTETGFTVTRVVHWAPDGRSILAFGIKGGAQSGQFGMVRWKVRNGKPAFSPNTADWTGGHFVTDVGTTNKGVIDAAISPDGKQLALISNQGASFFRLWLAKPGDFLLTKAKPEPVRGCKATWRGDSQELIVQQGDATCDPGPGALIRVPANDVRKQEALSVVGDDPAYQPFVLGK
jgi:hypothetical protein